MSGPLPSNVQSIVCNRCGGSIAIHRLEPQIWCPYCRQVQTIPMDKLAELSRYQHAAGAVLAQIDAEQQKRAQWEQWYGVDGKPRSSASGVWMAVGVGTFVTLIAAAGSLLGRTGVSGRVVNGLSSIGIIGVYGLAFVGYFAFLGTRRWRRRQAPPRVAATCPQCGAPQAFGVGEAFGQCAHCGAALLAGTRIMRRALDAARADLRSEAMSRYRLERTAMMNAYRASVGGWVPYIVLGSFLPITGGGAVAFTVEALTGSGDTPLAGLLLLWMLALLNGVLLVAVAAFRWARRVRWREIASRAAASLGGRVTTATPAWVAWLNALWAGPYEVQRLFTGPVFHAVMGHVGPFAVALDLDPVPADSEHPSARANAMLAASLPGDAEAVPVWPDIAERARGLGFALSSSTGGLLATGVAALDRMKRGDVGTASRSLVAISSLLAEWAARVGAAPVTNIP